MLGFRIRVKPLGYPLLLPLWRRARGQAPQPVATIQPDDAILSAW